MKREGPGEGEKKKGGWASRVQIGCISKPLPTIREDEKQFMECLIFKVTEKVQKKKKMMT